MSGVINAAILKAHVEGALDAACLMVGQPGTAEAIEMARAHPGLRIGWHVHLNDSQPMTMDAWPWRKSPARAGIAMTFSKSARRLAEAELVAQWQALKETGLPISFVNAHHHIHLVPFVREQLIGLLQNDDVFDGWIRWGEPRFFDNSIARYAYWVVDALLQAPARRRLSIRASDTLWGLDRPFAMNASEVAAVIPQLGAGLHEFMFHPRSPDAAPADVDTACLLALRATRRAQPQLTSDGQGN